MNERLPRRAFLGFAGLGASAVWMQGWLARSFAAARAGQEPLPEEESDEQPIPSLDVVLKEAFERARGVGKPLLVFVIPADGNAVWERQAVLGQYLNLCSPEALADLALCEVACARKADLATVFPEALEVDGEPLMVLVEGDRAGPVVRAIDAELPEVSALPFASTPEDLERAEREFEAATLRRVERLAELVQENVAGDRQMIERRAVEVRAVLAEGVDAQVEQILRAPSATSVDTIDRLAAPVRIAAEDRPEKRAACIDALARATRERLRLHPPAGAWWAQFTGCGHSLEGRVEYVAQYGCGMGRTPEVSRRFLHFYTTCKDLRDSDW